jgi:hypothetical protein
MKSTAPVRIHLTIPEEESERSSVGINSVPPLPLTVTLTKNKLKTNTQSSLSKNFDNGKQACRFSSVSSSYAQFLKQRDMDKVKKTVSQINLSIVLIRVHISFQSLIEF